MTAHCRWGILGTAGIARKNWKAIRLSGNAQVVAVGSRSTESAQRFIDECSSQVPQVSLPVAESSYQAVLDRDDVDAVYIPLPTALRHEWVIKAAESGKHVIGEKPAACNATQVEEMLAACRENSVQYMDGVMFMHSDRLPQMREVLESPGGIGTIQRLSSQFSFYGDDEFRTTNIRAHSDLEPYGCLGDLGWYCSRMFMWILKGELPVEVSARVLTPLQASGSPKSVPGEFQAELKFASGVTAGFYNAFIAANQQWVHVTGSDGHLRLDDFVLPYHGPEVAFYHSQDVFDVDNCEFHMEQHLTRHATREYDANASTAQEVKLFRNFSDIVLSGARDDSWPEWTLKTQRVLDACYESAMNDGKRITL
ncbi:MAG: Gfo/Idh/MocA family oxidoreductase [Planctomycetota bacterium]